MPLRPLSPCPRLWRPLRRRVRPTASTATCTTSRATRCSPRRTNSAWPSSSSKATRASLVAGLGRDVSDDEFAKASGVAVPDVVDARSLPRTSSMHTPVGDDGDSEMGDMIADESAPKADELVEETLRKEMLLTGLEHLSERKRRILELR